MGGGQEHSASGTDLDTLWGVKRKTPNDNVVGEAKVYSLLEGVLSQLTIHEYEHRVWHMLFCVLKSFETLCLSYEDDHKAKLRFGMTASTEEK